MFAKLRIHLIAVFLLVTILLCGILPATAQALPQGPVPSRITAPVDNAVRVTVARSTHPMAQAQFDRGPVDPGAPMDRMILVLSASAEQEHQARTLLDSQQTKGSPDYHQWLTPEEFGQKFGPSPQDIQQATAWLQQQGFSVGSVAKSGRWIEFSGTAAQVNQTFQTQMRNYQVEGRVHTANATDITIPAALAPVVRGVLSLHDFYSKPMHRMAKSPGSNANVNFGGPTHAIGPGDFAKIYNLGPLYTASLNGQGEAIAIVAVSNINTVPNNGVDDVAIFRNLFGLPASAPNIILNGPDPLVDTILGGGVEATLDTQWSGAVAPNAIIDVVVSGGTLTTDGVSLGSAFIVDENLAPVMNVSFGFCEQNLGPAGNSFWAEVWEQAAAQGISVFVSSGDSGAAGCDASGESLTAAQNGVAVSGFASTPFNTAVGGTEFNETVNGGLDKTFWMETPLIAQSVLGYIPEMVWNDSCTPTEAGTICPQLLPQDGQFLLLAGGGGLSTFSTTPSYQTLSISGMTPAVLKGARGLPDVSLNAAVQHDPYIVCFTTDPANPDCQLSGGSTGVITNNTFQNLAGGTSFASPAFAGIMAIVDQKLAERQGLANYVLYPLAAAESASPGFSNCNSSSRGNPGTATTCVFNDTTVGNNGVPGNDVTNDPALGALGFPTTTGYDLATGLGSVDVNNLVTAWANLTKGFNGTTTTLAQVPASGTITLTHGQAASLTVSVANQAAGPLTPSGDISLIAQGGTLTTGVGAGFIGITGSGGTATTGTFTVPDLPGGKSYNLVANYPGNGTFAGSTSNSLTVTVNPEGSTTTFNSVIFNINTQTAIPGTTVAYGDQNNILVIDATANGVSGQGTPTGATTFTGAGGTIKIPLDNSGIAELADCFPPLTACLLPGHYTVNASYSGDQSFNPSSAAPLSITVTPGTTAVSISGPATVSSGQQFTLTSQVNLTGLETIAPTGTVQFLDGGTALGSPATLSGGVASAQVTLSSGGAHNITAKYSGDGNYNAATSLSTTVTVAAPFSFAATAGTAQTIAAGATATYNLTINGAGGFTGAVSFSCTGAPGSSTCAVSPNPANLSAGTPSLPITVTVSNTANARLAPAPFNTLPFVFAVAFAGLLFGVRKKRRQALFMVLAMGLILGVGSCGGGGNPPPPPPPPPTIATLTVTGTNGGATNNITLTLTITH